MKVVACSQCHEQISVPDDLKKAHCVRCGTVNVLSDTNVTAEIISKPTSGIRPAIDHEIFNYSRSELKQDVERFTSWEDFRSNSAALQQELMQIATRPMPNLDSQKRTAPPETVEERTSELGDLLATYHLGGEYHRLNSTVAWCVMFGGALWIAFMTWIVIFGNAIRDEDIVGMTYGFAIPIIFIAFAGWYNLFREPNWRLSFWFYEHGVLCRRGPEFLVRQWQDVDDFWIHYKYGYPRLTLKLRDGVRFRISPDYGRGAEQLIQFIEIRASSAFFLPRLRQIFEGERVLFGEVSLDSKGITAPRFYAEWNDIASINEVQYGVYIIRRDKPSVHTIPLEILCFPMVLVAIANIYIAEGRRLTSLED